MKIAFFTDTYYPQLNGVTISVDNFAKELRKMGHTVYIFAPKGKYKKENQENLSNLSTIKLLDSEPPIYLPTPVSYKEYAHIFRSQFDIIHAHGNGAFSLLGYQVARLKGIPFLLTFHTLQSKYTHYFFNGRVIKPHMVETALRLFANLCDGIITPSEKMKKELISYGVDKPIHIIPNFVEKENFSKIQKHFLHKKLRLPQETPLLLSVGRLGKEKNFEFVIEAFSELAKKDMSSHLVIVGKGKEKKHLQEQVAKLNLTKRIHLTGNIHKKYMPSVYADSDIFIFASETETQGIVVLEACISGLPLVVVKDPAFTNIVIDKKNGYLLPLQKEQFAEKMQLLLQDDKLRKEMGEHSKEFVEKNFPPERLTEMLLEVYDTVLTTKSKRKFPQRINLEALKKLTRSTRFIDRFFS